MSAKIKLTGIPSISDSDRYCLRFSRNHDLLPFLPSPLINFFGSFPPFTLILLLCLRLSPALKIHLDWDAGWFSSARQADLALTL